MADTDFSPLYPEFLSYYPRVSLKAGKCIPDPEHTPWIIIIKNLMVFIPDNNLMDVSLMMSTAAEPRYGLSFDEEEFIAAQYHAHYDELEALHKCLNRKA